MVVAWIPKKKSLNGNTCLSMETKKTREFVIGVLPKGMVAILRTEIVNSMETKKTREFVIGVLPEGMVTILRTEIFKTMETKKTLEFVIGVLPNGKGGHQMPQTTG